MKQKSPSIGIVVCARKHDRVFISLPYIQSIYDHGGLPFVIPFFEDAEASFFRSCTKKLDGFLFCGGGDINPILLRQAPSPGIQTTDYEFDCFQLFFLDYLLKHSCKPILGICKGMQMINLACGGTLYQDLAIYSDFSNHNLSTYSRHDPAHSITTEKNTMLASLIGRHINVNSFHHQAVKEPGEGLCVCAFSPDGVIEAIEGTRHPFLLGLQWHPECMYLFSEKMSRIFSAFIFSCRHS